MPISDPVAMEEVLWARKDGSEVVLTAKIGKPYRVDEDTWACPVELIGLDEKLPDIPGTGSMQALCLAIGLVKMRLGHLLDRGEALYFSGDREEKWDASALDALFGP